MTNSFRNQKKKMECQHTLSEHRYVWWFGISWSADQKCCIIWISIPSIFNSQVKNERREAFYKKYSILVPILVNFSHFSLKKSNDDELFGELFQNKKKSQHTLSEHRYVWWFGISWSANQEMARKKGLSINYYSFSVLHKQVKNKRRETCEKASKTIFC
jgi:hypothetical protein